MAKRERTEVSTADLFVSTALRRDWSSRQAVSAFCFVLDEVEKGLTPAQRQDFFDLVALVLDQFNDPTAKGGPR
jgi:hypothetical protein